MTNPSILNLAHVPDLCAGGGLLETSTLLSFEQLLIDDEAMGNRKIQILAQDTGPESLAVDVLREVGPGGHFLAQRHTAQHMRDFASSRFGVPSASIVDGPERFEAPARQRVRDEAKRRIQSHEVEPLPEALASTLLEIAGASEAAS